MKYTYYLQETNEQKDRLDLKDARLKNLFYSSDKKSYILISCICQYAVYIHQFALLR